jgi:hypothetical protein
LKLDDRPTLCLSQRLLALETLLQEHEVGAPGVASKITTTGDNAARFFKPT